MTSLLRKPPYPALPAVTLKGFRIELRTPQREHGPEWIRVREKNRDFLKPFEPAWPADSGDLDFFRRRMERQASEWQAGRGQPFLIFLSGGALIGGLNVNNICRGAAQFASLGYWLDEDAQGKGYMAEALQAILGYGFGTLRLHRLNAGCLPHNERSKNLLLKSGFREEGYAEKYMEIDGRWQDHVLFGLPVEDWRGAAG
jgi:[ribosomal protein S5]-alanine N-acetyltransferase